MLALSGCASAAVHGGDLQGDTSNAENPVTALQGYVQADGRGLVIDGEHTRLQAVNFTNDYDEDIEPHELLESSHHSELDYERVRELGFNSVRFAFRGEWYLEDEEAFWQWLDQNVEWAGNQGIRLILDLHVPIGGYWLDPGEDNTDFRLWSDANLRQQNVDLWYDIARRYQDEPAVAAYDLLNEPVTTDSTGRQWQDFAQEIADAVRSVDDNHLLVVGAVYGVNGRFDPGGEEKNLLIEDENVMYDFHFYEPYEYTHQYASWVDSVQDGGRYPDSDRLVPTTTPTALEGNRIATPPLQNGTSDWQEYDSGIIPLEQRWAAAASPQVVVEGSMNGTAHFDNISVMEYGPDGTEIREVLQDPLDENTASNWYPWEGRGGEPITAELSRDASGDQDDGSLSVSGPVTSGAGWSNSEQLFRVVPGNQYRIRGYMRGVDVASAEGKDPRIGLQLEVLSESPGTVGDGFLPRDKSYLTYVLAKHRRFGAEHNVPMSVLEFGTMRHTFEMEGKGGELWVADMLDLLQQEDLSFAFWEYHDPEMGIYVNRTGDPSDTNPALVEVLRRELSGGD